MVEKQIFHKLESFKAVGIKNIGLHQFGTLIPQSLQTLRDQLELIPNRINPDRHYGLAPCSTSQDNPDTHTYYIVVEVSSFDGVPDGLECITIPSQTCVMVRKYSDQPVGDVFGATGELIKRHSLQRVKDESAYQVSLFHESLEHYHHRMSGKAADTFTMDLYEPVIAGIRKIL